MIEKMCQYLTERIRLNDVTIDEERAEIINYGLQHLFGELPKGIIILAISFLLGLEKLVIISTILFLIYRSFAGGIHLKTNLSCLFISGFIVIGGTYFSSIIELKKPIIIYTAILCINLYLVTLYAPADTYNKPIVSEEQKNRQKVMCYITIAISYLLSTFIIKDHVISNLILYTITVESLMITPLAYKLSNNRYGRDRLLEIERGEE